MRKFVFGLMVFLLGAVVSVFNYIDAVLNPCSYNGIGGLHGAFLGRGTLSITVLFAVIMFIGLGICGDENASSPQNSLKMRRFPHTFMIAF